MVKRVGSYVNFDIADWAVTDKAVVYRAVADWVIAYENVADWVIMDKGVVG